MESFNLEEFNIGGRCFYVSRSRLFYVEHIDGGGHLYGICEVQTEDEAFREAKEFAEDMERAEYQ